MYDRISHSGYPGPVFGQNGNNMPFPILNIKESCSWPGSPFPWIQRMRRKGNCPPGDGQKKDATPSLNISYYPGIQPSYAALPAHEFISLLKTGTNALPLLLLHFFSLTPTC